MKNLITIISILTCFNLSGQSFLIWEVPTEKGEIDYLLLTNEGYEKLLQPIQLGDLGELSIELLTQRKLIIEQQKIIELLEEKVEILENQANQRVNNDESQQVALDLYFKHNQGLSKSRNTINSAKKEGLTTYDEIYNYSLEILNLK